MPLDKGYTGLANLGNTCFLNACLQIIRHTHELSQIMTQCAPHAHRKESILYLEWNQLRALMGNHNGVVSPNKFVASLQDVARHLGRDLFTGWGQNDLPEFLHFIIECFHRSLCRKTTMKISGTKKNKTDRLAVECYKMLQEIYENEYSEILDLFYAISISEIASIDGKVVYSVKPEHFFMLELPIPDNPSRQNTLYDCFDLFVQPDHLTGDNAWFNPDTKSYEHVQKRIVFWNFPKVLIVVLKRFSATGEEKRETLVSFPLKGLDLSKYVVGYQPDKYVYDLYGVCNHHGDVRGGHYNNVVMNVTDGTWVLYDDVQCLRVDSVDGIVTPQAYTLFYRMMGI